MRKFSESVQMNFIAAFKVRDIFVPDCRKDIALTRVSANYFGSLPSSVVQAPDGMNAAQ